MMSDAFEGGVSDAMATETNESKMEVEMAQTESDAAEYLQRHKIKELMDNLISMLFYYRPEDPYVYLIEQLQQLKTCQQTNVQGPSLLNDSNMDTAFAIMDPAEQRFVTFAQYKQALTTLGLHGFNECPEGVNDDKISQETFSMEATEGLKRCSATYAPLE